MKKILILVLAVCSLNIGQAQRNRTKTTPDPNKPKNVVLLIGDGMGTAQIFSLIAVRDNTAFDQFKYIGFSKTASANKFITDSGAGGTALATGQKANNKSISVHPETKEPLQTLVQLANAKNLSTGVVASCAIVHATPGSFLAHNENRDNYEELAADLLNTHPTLIIGGGRNYFEKRADKRNLSDSLRVQGFDVLYTMDDLQKSQKSKVAALLFEKHPESMLNGRGDYLRQSSVKALELLSQNEKGFFMMIEGSQIDWECHDNNYPGIIAEMDDFNSTIAAVLEFAKKDGNTLVIVTADHETGGMVPMDKDPKVISRNARFSTFDHSPIMVPVFAFGPGAEQFGGIYENTEVQKKIRSLLGI